MPEKPFLGAFTDIPSKEGYEDVTKRPDWITYPEEPPTMKMPKKPKGIKEFVTPDYSRRDEFEKLVFKKIGENPFQIDVMAEVNKANEDLPDLFRHIFRGKVIWEDRGRLNKKQIDYWDDIVKQYRSDVYNQVTSDKAQKIEEHKWMMGQFDSKAAEYKAAVGRARTAHEKITKEWKEERKPKDITKLSDFKWAYALAKKKRPKLTALEFKREWEKPTGGLTEGAVVKSINEMSWNVDDPIKWSADTYNKYLEYRGKGLSREEALNKVQQEMVEVKLPPEIKTTSQAMEYLIKNKGMTEQQAKDWIRSQR